MDPITLQNLINAAQGGVDGAAPDASATAPAEPAKAVAEYLAAHPEIDVAALQAEAVKSFTEISAAGADSDESLAAVEALADVIDGVKVEQERVDAAGEVKRTRLAELSNRVKAATGSDAPEGEDNADADATVDADADTGAEAAADAGAVDAGEGGGDVDAGASTEAAPEAVAASAAKPVKRVRLSQIPRKTVVMPAENTVDTKPRATIIASADVAGFGQGTSLTTSDLARAANVKLQGFPSDFIPNQEYSVPVASISIPFEEQLTADGKNDQEAIDYAADTSRLKGGSLVAGGWCAPSETLYELGGILADAGAGLVDLPEVQAKRGGLRFTEGPDYAAIYGDPTFGFIQTEPQSIAGTGFTTATGGTVTGTEKPFYRVPCPEFTDVRAEAVGLGVVAGILANDAYPEVTQEVVEHGLIAHAHRINTRTLNRQAALSGTPIALALGPSATTSVLNAVDIQISDYRYANRMADNAELEVVLPLWGKPVIRADQAVRNGSNVSEALEVTDQKIEAWFRARNARVQWVYDWQDAFSGVTGGFGAATPITAWPTTIDIMIYKAGTFVRARGEIINVSAMYDTVNLKKNDYHVIFIEEKLLVIKRRWKSRLVRVPLAVNGAVGAARELDAQGKIVVTTP
ncbi:major capsid protein [Rhodococcus sp. IEGM 1379]|uniref:major capsid protein n=1 Tax=Rhodococcus sp. IEGM 1379 TaxID=3047086 RepID=UPI0024B6462B|nr:major capsid protein [Rhodococcus sp. IEGM 1379]MDI9914366.1 major capsid protein [Rhodococcus sp. IEGM 1379]